MPMFTISALAQLNVKLTSLSDADLRDAYRACFPAIKNHLPDRINMIAQIIGFFAEVKSE